MRNKNYFITITIIWIILSACSQSTDKAPKGNTPVLRFVKNDRIKMEEAPLFQNKKIISLSTTNDILVPGYPSLCIDQDEFFIFNENNPVLHFDSNGKYINTIGSLGDGPKQYPDLICGYINPKNHRIEILSSHGIYQYSPQGDFIKHHEINLPALSFAIDTNSIYWFYTGNNSTYSPYKLFRKDSTLTNEKSYLKQHSNLLPLKENNFSKNSYLTLHESLNHTLYTIGNEVKEAYRVKIPNLEIPSEIHELPPMKVMEYLSTHNFASIRSYLENNTFIYLLISENKVGEEPIFYHWFIDKKNKNELLVEQESGISDDSYLFSPQALLKNNILYFIGYPIEKRNEVSDPDTNPSIITIDISEINTFNKDNK